MLRGVLLLLLAAPVGCCSLWGRAAPGVVQVLLQFQ